ncbi:hypothetical protein JCM10369A_01530 [Nocardioides pyridinolyticus]
MPHAVRWSSATSATTATHTGLLMYMDMAMDPSIAARTSAASVGSRQHKTVIEESS